MFLRLAPAALLALVITAAGGHPGFADEDTVVATVNPDPVDQTAASSPIPSASFDP